MSVFILCLLLVILFLGRSLVYFSRQSGENVLQYREEVQLHLAAEDAVERVWADWPHYEERFAVLEEGQPIYLSENTMTSKQAQEIKTYAMRKEGRIYLIACAFKRGEAYDDVLEAHSFAKGVIKKVKINDKEYYKWLGWTD